MLELASQYTCPMHPEVRLPGPGACPKCGMSLEAVVHTPPTPSQWVCPMHSEIVADQPGTCPICGMALEPRAGAAEEASPELRDMSRRLLFAAALTVPLALVAMGDLFPGAPLSSLLSRTRTRASDASSSPPSLVGGSRACVFAVLTLRSALVGATGGAAGFLAGAAAALAQADGAPVVAGNLASLMAVTLIGSTLLAAVSAWPTAIRSASRDPVVDLQEAAT